MNSQNNQEKSAPISSESRRTEKKSGAKRVVKRVILVLVSLILLFLFAALITFAVLYHVGKSSVKPGEISVTAPAGVELEDNGVTVYYNGKKYRYNEDIAVFLLLGVDKESFDDENEIGLNGQADAVFVAALDTAKGTVDLISLSRESMVDVNVYSVSGSFIRTERMQLCLAYAYGDGKQTSCENVATSVSRLLYGVPISSYAAIDLDAVSVLNDAVGGVEVPEYADDLVTETGKTVTLYGDDAERYIRMRDKSTLDSNNARIERQKSYIRAFASKAAAQIERDIGVSLALYNSLNGYMVTNITAGEVTYLAANFLGGVQNMQMHNIPGTVVQGEKYAEYEVDAEALYELLLDVFYTEV